VQFAEAQRRHRSVHTRRFFDRVYANAARSTHAIRCTFDIRSVCGTRSELRQDRHAQSLWSFHAAVQRESRQIGHERSECAIFDPRDQMRPESGSPSDGPIGHVALLVARGAAFRGRVPPPCRRSAPLASSACGDNGLAVRLPIDAEQEKLTAMRRTLWKIGVVIVISAFRFLDWTSSLVEWNFGSKEHSNEAEDSERVER
jgi:hypothetical protein